MTFLLDHDVPEDLSYSLEALGHGVVRLRNVLPPTAKDEEVLERAAIVNLLDRAGDASVVGNINFA